MRAAAVACDPLRRSSGLTSASTRLVNPLTLQCDRSQMARAGEAALSAPGSGFGARPPILKGSDHETSQRRHLRLPSCLHSATQAAWSQTLNAVKDRGELICGANGTLAGFGLPDPQGNWTGFDVDFCRAIAAAIFNDPTKVKFVPLTAKNRFTALQSGEIDVLSRNTTWTLSRDTSLGLDFAAVTYYDGQGFMVRKALKVNSALELNGASVCVQQGTTTELNLADYFRVQPDDAQDRDLRDRATRRQGLRVRPLRRLHHRFVGPLRRAAEARRSGRQHRAARNHLQGAAQPGGAPGRRQWVDIVRWTHYAMVDAEELGVTKTNVDEQLKSAESGDPAAARRRGSIRRVARPDQRLGLSHHQARRQLRREFSSAISARARR